MARYTETFLEYLQNGNKLPAVFNSIEGFNDLFIAKYCDHEIGFETEELFKLKLEALAGVYIPLYKERLDTYNAAILKAKDPTKVYETTNENTFNSGDKESESTELPIDTLNAEATATAKQKAFTDTNKGKTSNTEKGMTVAENYMVLEKLEKQVKSIKETLLDQFNVLFMKVYF